MSRRVRTGEDIGLRVLFKDDLGASVQPVNPELYIYEPGTTEFLPVNAYSGPHTPTYLGDGLCEYVLTAAMTPEGTWYDAWAGTVNGQLLESVMQFEVYSATGELVMLDESMLGLNQVVTVTIPVTLLALDGSHLETPYVFDFMTKISPAYSSIRKLMLSAGSFLSELDDDIMQTAILEASLAADVLRFSTTIVNSSLYEHARREYTTCLATSMLIHNLLRSPLKSKQLDNFAVSYDTNGLRDMLKKLEDCLESWQDPLQTGGGPASGSPKMIIKGRTDPDRPPIGRNWETVEDGGVPVGNGYVKYSGMRRWFKTRL